MTCGGCSGAIERVLSKMTNLDSFNVDLASQDVVVKPSPQGGATFDEVTQKIKKTGKEILEARQE